MKIAIIGAPGSGKTALAEELENFLKSDKASVAIVDDYVDEIGKKTDFAMGTAATYIGNLYVVLGRYEREREATRTHTHSITCGTFVESSIYTTMDTVAGQTPAHWVRCNNFMALLGNLKDDTWNYDHVFVLSLEDPDPDSPDSKVDEALFMALSAFGLNFTPLNGTLEEKVAAAKTEIEGAHLGLEDETPLRSGA